LTGPGKKWLASLHEIGESKDEAEQLRRDHDQLELKLREIVDGQLRDLKQLADELLMLLAQNNDSSSRKSGLSSVVSVEHVLKQSASVDMLVKDFVGRLKHQTGLVQLSSCFHGLVDEVGCFLK